MKFEDLALSPSILSAVQESGYSKLSPIQEKAIPAVLLGRDLLAASQTGTGKTAAFVLPMLEKLKTSQAGHNLIRALILTPTRELAAQVFDSVKKYSQHTNLKAAVVFGGVKINPQMMRLRNGVDILIATPGRLLDLHAQNAVRFTDLEFFVLDEADRMLDMGFIGDIRKIVKKLPQVRQNLMFSATFSPDIRDLAKTIVHKPVEITISQNTTAVTIQQIMHPVDKRKKAMVLEFLIKQGNWTQVLVFTKTKRSADKLALYLETKGITAAVIHGNKSQNTRTKALQTFKDGLVRVLVATDIAARGIDIDQLPQVVNYELPQVAEDYVHRIGRTGRAGAQGFACSLISADEAPLLFDIERLIQKHIKREYLQEYVPTHEVPVSPAIKPPKKHRPKNRKSINSQAQTNEAPQRNESGHKPKRGPFKKRESSDTFSESRSPRKTAKFSNKSGASKAGSGKSKPSRPGTSKPGTSKTGSARTGRSQRPPGKRS